MSLVLDLVNLFLRVKSLQEMRPILSYHHWWGNFGKTSRCLAVTFPRVSNLLCQTCLLSLMSQIQTPLQVCTKIHKADPSLWTKTWVGCFDWQMRTCSVSLDFISSSLNLLYQILCLRNFLSSLLCFSCFPLELILSTFEETDTCSLLTHGCLCETYCQLSLSHLELFSSIIWPNSQACSHLHWILWMLDHSWAQSCEYFYLYWSYDWTSKEFHQVSQCLVSCPNLLLCPNFVLNFL